MATGHSDNSLLQRYFVFYLADVHDVGNLIYRNLFLNDDVFESEDVRHHILVLDPLLVQLQHHVLRSQSTANFGIYQFFEIFTCDCCVYVSVVALSIS